MAKKGGNPQNLKPFKDGYDERRNTKGPPRKIYTILKEKGYSADDIKTAFGEMAWYTLKELQQVHTDDSKPVIMRIVANQLFQALKKGDWSKIKEILEHVIGKPTQKNEHSGGLNITSDPTQAREKLANLLSSKIDND